MGGFLVYTDRMKTDLLGVDPEVLARHTSVSEEAARAMAAGARSRTGSTYAISVTGEAGPESASGAPVGTVVIGFAGPGAAPEAERFTLFGGREGVRARAAQWALDYLRRRIK
jgi:PncC family amidohydrolase